MVEDCRSCSSIHFLSLYSHLRRENRERAARTENQCTLPLSSSTTSTGGLGYCEFAVKYFKVAAGGEPGPCLGEMKHTWFPASPLIKQG